MLPVQVIKESDLLVPYFLKNLIANYPEYFNEKTIADIGENFRSINGSSFETKYQQWYTKCLILLSVAMPERKTEFVRLYEPDPKRKELSLINYTILDAIHGVSRGNAKPPHALTNVQSQIAIMKSLGEVIDDKLYALKSLIENEVFESELDSSKYLLDKGFNRSAGAICGVLLEKHLSTMCEVHKIGISKKGPSISDYNAELYKALIIDLTQNKYITYLADIRNKCDHNKTKEPTKEEIEDLISGTKKVLSTYI